MESVNTSISKDGLTHLLPSYIINEIVKTNKNNISYDCPGSQKCNNKIISVSN